MIELFIPVFLFALSNSITPGPNNMMLTSSGATFGFRRTFPHMLGVILGFPAMTLLVGMGLAQILIASPLLQTILKYGSIGYLLYLAWRVASSGETKAGQVTRPLNFLQAAAFQWVNPKAWIMAVGAMGAYSDPARGYADIFLIVICFFLSGLISTTLWAGFGTVIGQLLSSPFRLRVFNISIALLLVASLIPLLPTLK